MFNPSRNLKLSDRPPRKIPEMRALSLAASVCHAIENVCSQLEIN